MTSNVNDNSGVGCGVSTSRPTPGPVSSAISAALESNAALQKELKRRLLKIRRAQIQNRRDAAKVVASISCCLNNDDGSEFNLKEGEEDAARNDGNENGTVAKSIQPQFVPKFAKSRNSKWARKNRKWTRGFFTDPDGSTPDTLLIDTSAINQTEASSFTAQTARVAFERKKNFPSHRQPEKTWDEAKRKNHPTSSLDTVSLRIDNASATSADGCYTAYFTFADSKIAKAKFKKQESLFIMSMVSKLEGEAQRGVDWYDIAREFYAKFKRQTPWLCFSHCRSSLQNPSLRCPPWSQDDDEILLKYVAAHGPQFLHQGESLVQLCRNMFPVRNLKQLTARAHQTLINPNYVQDSWSADEKRKLALLMRIYSNEQNPLMAAARREHFLDRSPKSVLGKWRKSLDPALKFCPFTPSEDEELQESSGQWSLLGKKFPNRPVDSLKRRWAEVADEHAVATHVEDRIIDKTLAKRKGAYEQGVGSEGDLSLGVKDFLVLPKSKVARYQK